MNVESVDDAEKEASEVLHSLLSVERIEKPLHLNEPIQQQVMIVECKRDAIVQRNISNTRQQWTTHCEDSLSETVFNHADNYQSNDWEGSFFNNSINQDQTVRLSDTCNTLENHNVEHYKNDITNNDSLLSQTKQKSCKIVPVKKTIRKRYNKNLSSSDKDGDAIEEEIGADSAHEVRVRFKMGCECQDDCCFKGLNPENVYKHRLNIAELTKEEHDMYLMGVTMACIADPGVTAKQRKRRRLRAQYVYQGRRVCLSAFLYLENCTLYQLKRIRKHVMTHGVAPRVHGNHGKKPHNVFPLDTYRKATEFLKSYIEKYSVGSGNMKSPVLFSPEISRKTIHNVYKQTMIESGPQKIMGYSTFRHFMKEQFPQVRFCKQENASAGSSLSSSSNTKLSNTNSSNNVVINNNCSNQNSQPHLQQTTHPGSTAQQQNVQNHQLITTSVTNNHNTDNSEQPNISIPIQSSGSTTISPNALSHPVTVSASSVMTSTSGATIPLILSDASKSDLHQQTAYIVTPVSQLVQPFQTGHAITVTPITNTAYAFTTI